MPQINWLAWLRAPALDMSRQWTMFFGIWLELTIWHYELVQRMRRLLSIHLVFLHMLMRVTKSRNLAGVALLDIVSGTKVLCCQRGQLFKICSHSHLPRLSMLLTILLFRKLRQCVSSFVILVSLLPRFLFWLITNLRLVLLQGPLLVRYLGTSISRKMTPKNHQRAYS